MDEVRSSASWSRMLTTVFLTLTSIGAASQVLQTLVLEQAESKLLKGEDGNKA